MRVHCCLFDRDCLRHARRYGMPLRLYIGRRYWTILENNRRSERIWRDATVYKRDTETNKWYRRDDATGEWIETERRPRYTQDE